MFEFLFVRTHARAPLTEDGRRERNQGYRVGLGSAAGVLLCGRRPGGGLKEGLGVSPGSLVEVCNSIGGNDNLVVENFSTKQFRRHRSSPARGRGTSMS